MAIVERDVQSHRKAITRTYLCMEHARRRETLRFTDGTITIRLNKYIWAIRLNHLVNIDNVSWSKTPRLSGKPSGRINIVKSQFDI